MKCEFYPGYDTHIANFKDTQFRPVGSVSEDDSNKVKIDGELEKKIISSVYDLLTDGSYVHYKFKEKIGTVRNLQFPRIYKNEIESHFPKDKILFYGSLALDKSNISDYDLMYIPDNYQNTIFDISHMMKMYDFVTKIYDQINRKCTKAKLQEKLGSEEKFRGYEFTDEHSDTMTIFKYNGTPLYGIGNPPKATTHKSGIKDGCFKISVLPNLWINIGSTASKEVDNVGVRFCLFRIKIMLKGPDGFVSIPIMDLSYHFCNKINDYINPRYPSIHNCSVVPQECDNDEPDRVEDRGVSFGDKQYTCFKCTKNIYIKTVYGSKTDFHYQLITVMNRKMDSIETFQKTDKIMGRMSQYAPPVILLSANAASGMSGGKKIKKKSGKKIKKKTSLINKSAKSNRKTSFRKKSAKNKRKTKRKSRN